MKEAQRANGVGYHESCSGRGLVNDADGEKVRARCSCPCHTTERIQDRKVLLDQGLSGLSDGRQQMVETSKATRWRPGQPSPNPSGRPKDDPVPISSALKLVLLKTRIPKGHALRIEFEKATGIKLKGKITLVNMYAHMLAWDPLMAKFPNLSVKKVMAVTELAQGKEAPRAFEPRQQNINADTGDELRERILLGLLGVIKRRSEIYGLKNTAMKKLEEEALEFEKKAQ